MPDKKSQPSKMTDQEVRLLIKSGGQPNAQSDFNRILTKASQQQPPKKK